MKSSRFKKEKSVSATALSIDFVVAVIATDMQTWVEIIHPYEHLHFPTSNQTQRPYAAPDSEHHAC
jgi:hypothetical protein